MEWIKTEQRNPKFGEHVLVFCKIYGIFIASFEEICDSGWGNWSDLKGNLGILPPLYWMPLPEPPKETKP